MSNLIVDKKRIARLAEESKKSLDALNEMVKSVTGAERPGHKYIKREPTATGYKYVYRDNTGKEQHGDTSKAHGSSGKSVESIQAEPNWVATYRVKNTGKHVALMSDVHGHYYWNSAEYEQYMPSGATRDYSRERHQKYDDYTLVATNPKLKGLAAFDAKGVPPERLSEAAQKVVGPGVVTDWHQYPDPTDALFGEKNRAEMNQPYKPKNAVRGNKEHEKNLAKQQYARGCRYALLPGDGGAPIYSSDLAAITKMSRDEYPETGKVGPLNADGTIGKSGKQDMTPADFAKWRQLSEAVSGQNYTPGKQTTPEQKALKQLRDKYRHLFPNTD